MEWRKLVAAYFDFTRKDRIGVLVLVILIFIVFLLPDLLSMGESPIISPDTAWIASVKKLEIKRGGRYKTDSSRKNTTEDNGDWLQYDRSQNSRTAETGKLFNFDPNTLSVAGWKELGIRDKTIQTIQNYLGKGGHFKKPEDLQRVYGFRETDYKRLYSFVKIEVAASQKQVPPFEVPVAIHKTFRYAVVDINTGDTASFISLPGIGSKLAARIVNFREKLGGFYAVEQIAEVYGLADSVFQKVKQYLRLENFTVRQININTATIDELKSHPYIRYNTGNSIIAYRNEHGRFSAIEDTKKIMSITNELYNKIAPYLTIE